MAEVATLSRTSIFRDQVSRTDLLLPPRAFNAGKRKNQAMSGSTSCKTCLWRHHQGLDRRLHVTLSRPLRTSSWK